MIRTGNSIICKECDRRRKFWLVTEDQVCLRCITKSRTLKYLLPVWGRIKRESQYFIYRRDDVRYSIHSPYYWS